MKNIVVTLDEKVAAWARVEAAKAGKSLSRWVGEIPSERMGAGGEDRFGGLRRLLEEPAWPSAIGSMPKRAELY